MKATAPIIGGVNCPPLDAAASSKVRDMQKRQGILNRQLVVADAEERPALMKEIEDLTDPEVGNMVSEMMVARITKDVRISPESESVKIVFRNTV